MKVLFIGDQHFETKNLPQVDIFINKLKCYLEENKVDIIVSMGDLLHKHERLHTLCLNKAVEYINMLSSFAKTYILVGNHDATSNTIFLGENHWLNCLKNKKLCTIIDNVVIENFNNIKLTFVPYVSDGRFKEALNTRKDEWEESDIIFSHQLINNAKMGSIISENVEDWDENLPLVISGHVHDKQKVQSNWYYLGSCSQQAFGESHDKTILLLTINDNKNIKFEEINLHLPTKKIIYMDISDIDNIDEIKFKDKDIEYKIVFNGEQSEFDSFRKTNKYKNIKKLGVKLDFKHKRVIINNKKRDLKKQIKELTKSFNEILKDLIDKENNDYIKDMFLNIVLNQSKIENDDIIILD